MSEMNSKKSVQAFGRALSGMVMPNIGAFIAWGLITALFIPTGWVPNENLAKLVGPMIVYLLPLLIGYTGGSNVYGVRGGVLGAIATMGVVVGTDIPMFIGAMIMGPLGGYAIKKFDEAIDGKIPSGFEMLVNNFSAGIIGTLITLIAFKVVGPTVQSLSETLGSAVDTVVKAGFLPLVSIFIEPAKILFLNNAINHGVLTPLGAEQAKALGQSIFFLLETNPGPGLGILLAYWFFAKGNVKQSAPGAVIIHFLGGIHEIYFPYVLVNPALLLAVIAGGMSGVFTFTLFNAGLVASPSPGSIFALMAMTPKGGYVGVLSGVLVSTAVSFAVASIFVKRSASKIDDSELEKTKDIVKEMKDESKGIAKPNKVNLIVYACDAGMGSSAMGASVLSKRLKKDGYDIIVKNFPVNDIPKDADIVVTHEQLTSRAKGNAPAAFHLSVTDFLDSSIVERIEALIGEKLPERAKKDEPRTNKLSDAFVLENIQANCVASDKEEAIRAAGKMLVERGYVEPEYVEAMLEREKDITTYLGCGVAIPHGVASAKGMIKKSGIVLLQYPQGVDFDDEKAYLVIGVAGIGNEHLDILSQIASVIEESTIEDIQKLASSDVNRVYELFSK